MMTGRRACDEVTFGVDPSECLTASGYSELPQARLYPSSARTPPRLASRRPSSPQGPLAVPSCSGSGRDAPLRLRRSLLHPAAQRPPPSPPQRQQRSRSDRPVAADGEKREPGTGTGMGSVSRWHRRLPGRPHESLHSRAASQFLQKKVHGPEQGRCPAHRRTGPARHWVPASPRSSSPGPGGSWGQRARVVSTAAGDSAPLLRGASAAGGWRLWGLARAARSVPGGGARRHRGRRRIPQVLPLLLAPLLSFPSWPERPGGLWGSLALQPLEFRGA